MSALILKSVKSAIVFMALMTLGFVSTASYATETPISVSVNMARILRINSPAATVIIGNPGIADVTIQDAQTLILTGKNYGRTNLIILDAVGNPVADTLVDVVQPQSGHVTMYFGASRTTLTCEPVCQPTLSLGDNPEFTSQTLASSALIEGAE